MTAPSTTTVEIDTALLERLRKRSPGKSDRELVEDLATITLGFETIARVQERNADEDEDEVMAEAVTAVREVRRELAGDKNLLDHADLEPPAWSPKTACAQLGLP
jgi:hypothetical protein